MKQPFSTTALAVLALAGGIVFFIPGGADRETAEAPSAFARVVTSSGLSATPSASSPSAPVAAALGRSFAETATVYDLKTPVAEPLEAATFGYPDSPSRASTKRWQRAADARRNARRATEPARVLTSNSPGASLTVEDQAVTVEATLEVAGSPNPALSMRIAERADPTDQPDLSDPASSQDPEPPTASSGGPTAPGMTYEEEIFRTKWGWAAYDQARRAALSETQTAEVNP